MYLSMHLVVTCICPCIRLALLFARLSKEEDSEGGCSWSEIKEGKGSVRSLVPITLEDCEGNLDEHHFVVMLNCVLAVGLL